MGALKVGKGWYGGKHDDISVIVAQFHGEDVPRAAQSDKEFFLEDKYLYTEEDGEVMSVSWAKRV